LGIVLLCLGFPDQALAQSNAAIAEARRLAHPTSLAVSLTLGSLPLWLVGITQPSANGQPSWLRSRPSRISPSGGAQERISRGWVKVQQGDVTEGISLLRSGASAYRVTGAVLLNVYYSTLLALAYEIAGRVDESMTLLDEASQIVERTEERWFAAELNRHKGQLGHSAAAEIAKP